MARQNTTVFKEIEITNNCPECFNQDLKLSFYQKHTETLLFKKTAPGLTHEIKCKKCFSMIYPVNWTPDIERVFDYYTKLVQPPKKSIRFTGLFYMLVLLVFLLVTGVVYLYVKGILS